MESRLGGYDSRLEYGFVHESNLAMISEVEPHQPSATERVKLSRRAAAADDDAIAVDEQSLNAGSVRAAA